MPDPVVATLTRAFPDEVETLATPHEIPQVRVGADRLRDVCEWLKRDGFAMLLDVAAVDYHPREPRFEVVYHMLDLAAKRKLRLRVPVSESAPEVASVHDIWPSAAAAEREVYDLFGVVFSGHPNLKRILMPDDWEGHPLRKDYPLQGPRAAARRFPSEAGRFHAPKAEPGQ